MILDDPLDQGQPDPGADLLGGEKRIGGVHQVGRAAAAAGIADDNAHLLVLHQHLDHQFPALGHGLDAVAGQMHQGLLDQFRVDLHLRIDFRQAQHPPDPFFLHAAEMQQQGFVDQLTEPHSPAHRLAPVDETEQVLEDLFDFLRLPGHHLEKLQQIPVVRFPRQQSGRTADGGDRVADAVGELGGHVAHRRVPLRLDEQVLVAFQDGRHFLEFLDLFLHGHVQAAVIDGQAGLAGETLERPHPLVHDRFPGDEMVGNDHAERPAG